MGELWGKSGGFQDYGLLPVGKHGNSDLAQSRKDAEKSNKKKY